MSKRLVLALAVAGSALVSSVAAAQDTIRVGWTIPAEEAKYWMMRRPEQFPNLGKTYKIEFTQFQGTAPMVQAMVAGALDCSTQAPLSLANGALQANLQAYIISQHVGERPGSFSVYWAVKDEFADQDHRRHEGQERRHQRVRLRHPGPHVPAAQEERRSTRRRTSSWSRPAFRAPRTPSARAASTSACSTSRSPRAPRPRAACASCSRSSDQQQNIVHILEVCRKEFVDKNPELVKQLRARPHRRHEEGARQSRGDPEGGQRGDQGADPGARDLPA